MAAMKGSSGVDGWTPSPHGWRVAVALLILAACTRTAMSREPAFRLNPHPSRPYEITVTVKDAPAPFDSIGIHVLYQVVNDRCIRVLRGSGATPVLERSVPVELTRVGGNRYTGTMFADLMQDEDYFGLGTCHWTVESANAEARINRLVLSTGVMPADSGAPASVERFFSNRSFVDSQRSRVSIGNARRSDFGPDASNTFSIVLTVVGKPR
ncbi:MULTISPECIES: hypothetical protein [Burkholderia]|uniref:Lipoprotein n=1 Tax=Burkholderia paludis TaxID=1506587 RepID=A0A6J5DYL4_9BURK|nr:MULTISPECIES: hypothetical protein [Burkholderia]CAB3759123.1 hypothetical protein LMG30113_03372 [Burkholderia paludis]VWB53277.1 hypothetical protein BPA30113_02314 [Burkholderia paludis]